MNINHIDAIHAHDIKIGDRLIPVSRSNKTELLGKLRIG
ncbi:MAG: hypothetical protein JST70_15785 [Bacteroidetes bacterium]|nr:hypothetical protein [Bacteroidota bacterium]